MPSEKTLPKFILIGPDTENTRDLLQEIEARGCSATLIKLRDVLFEFVAGRSIATWRGLDLDAFDIFIFRGYDKNLLFAQLLARNLLAQKKVVLDETLGGNYLSGKNTEALFFSQKNILHPRTYQAVSISAHKKILPNLKFPIIVKPVDGQKGQGIEKFDDVESAMAFFQKNPKNFLIQEYLPIDGDIRIFVVDGKVLGAIKRMVIPGDYRSNASLGAVAKKFLPTPAMEVLALQAVSVMDYEVAGVDLIENDGKLYILEVNIAPQWQKFKEITGINPAKHIINYAIEKYEKN